MVLFFIFMLTCLVGFILFKRVLLTCGEGAPDPGGRISVIIPARNEEHNLPHLLDSLGEQTLRPDEIIVVNDFSSDRTAQVAREFGVTVIDNQALPEGWTGKTWAVWNGYLASSGDILVFLDADVRLSPRALAALIRCRRQVGGAISAVPYHYTERFYERLSLVLCLLGVYAFVSPWERRDARSLYGSCIVTTREDYDRVRGHDGIRSELLDDINLGKRFMQAGIPVKNYIGWGMVSFRMYPTGIVSELQGFGKGAVLSTATLHGGTTALIALWVVGLLAVGFGAPVLTALGHPWAPWLWAGYALYTAQLYGFMHYTGRYGVLMPLIHPVSSLFFLVVMAYSAWQVTFRGSVAWKGRLIKVGKRAN